MNLAELHKKLIASARSHPPDDAVPYCFEQRIMARLKALPKPDEWALWARSLWCGAGACVAIALCIGIWSFSSEREVDVAGTFSHAVEQTILASAGEGDAAW
jgi:hypothetical protein